MSPWLSWKRRWRTCRCGHQRDAHEHYRRGTDLRSACAQLGGSLRDLLRNEAEMGFRPIAPSALARPPMTSPQQCPFWLARPGAVRPFGREGAVTGVSADWAASAGWPQGTRKRGWPIIVRRASPRATARDVTGGLARRPQVECCSAIANAAIVAAFDGRACSVMGCQHQLWRAATQRGGSGVRVGHQFASFACLRVCRSATPSTGSFSAHSG